MAANLLLLALVVLFVVQNPNTSATVGHNAQLSSEVAANPLDQLSSAEIAVHAAQMVSLDPDETQAVVNTADSVNAQLSIAPADDKVVSKPQIVSTALKTKKDVKHYTVAQGDTIESIASKFGVTSNSVRWSNNLTGSSVAAGKSLLISPLSDGIVYVVKAGDTADILAKKYHTDKDVITSFNDAERSGLVVGDTIVIPGGSVQTVIARASTYRGGGGYIVGGFTPAYSGNGYARGYCTWWAAYRRAQAGHPIPSNLGNAVTWKVLSQRAGMPGGTTPRAGAVIWFPFGGAGHVGYVESVSEDGSVNISDMNWAGHWNRVTYRTIPASQLGGFYFIY